MGGKIFKAHTPVARIAWLLFAVIPFALFALSGVVSVMFPPTKAELATQARQTMIETKAVAATNQADAARANARARIEAAKKAAAGPYTAGDVAVKCQSAVEARLYSPSTAKWSGLFGVPGAIPRRMSYDHKWLLIDYVDAQNAMGGTPRNTFACFVYDDGRVHVDFQDQAAL